MKEINTIDLWTEQLINHAECFCGAFIDGFEGINIPFDSYKVVKNCNCVIFTNDSSINISNKHNAIIFYKNNEPVRLLVINRETDVDKCIEIALNQSLNGEKLSVIFDMLKVKRRDVDMKQSAITNDSDRDKEIDGGSCDRLTLLESMLKGSYTQSDTGLGLNNIDKNFEYVPNIGLLYILKTDEECFNIQHTTAFVNSDRTRIIPLQSDSSLDIHDIADNYLKK